MSLLASIISGVCPVLLAALGAMVAARAGIFHLGLEAHIIVGSFAAVVITQETGSALLGLAVALGVNAVLAAVFWVVVDILRADVIIAGIGLTGLGLGVTAFLSQVLLGTVGGTLVDEGLPEPLAWLAREGPGDELLHLSVVVLLTPVLVLGAFLVVHRSVLGVQIAATGQNPDAARSAGVHVARIRLMVLVFAGMLSGLAGAQLALGGLQLFAPGMSAGRGFLALAAAALGGFSVVGTCVAAVFFGVADAIGIEAQLRGVSFLPVEAVLMIPYVLTIAAVAATGLRRRLGIGTVAPSGI